MSDAEGDLTPRESARGRPQLHLVGFMGCGKSTVGALLARRLLWNFLDLDTLVARHDGRPVAEIFAHEGEEAFREVETFVLRQAIRKPRTVVALGGGAFERDRNRELCARAAVTVWLRCDLEVLRRRVGDEDEERPLWADETALRLLLERRERSYALADLTVDADAPAEEVAAGIVARIDQ